MQAYWTQLSSEHLSTRDDGLAAICYAGMPVWFNRFLDVYQRKAMVRLLTNEQLTGRHVLDVGTGVGRWARWFAERGASSVVGIDMEAARLDQARRAGSGPITYLQMPVDELAFEASSFDLVSSVTVLQHVEDAIKRPAIREIARVLKPGGKAIVFEETHTGDDAAHVFPWPRETWEAEFAKYGLVVERTVGDQYTPLLRGLKSAFTLLKGKNSRAAIEMMKSREAGSQTYMMLPLRLAVLASYPVEEVTRFLPAKAAKITGLLLTKRS
jgi:ubiquinone/menaquinone biosynthesis C-methylase UbiE